jgi:beta-lactamase regulating signal transducer with metallopeptidase domain
MNHLAFWPSPSAVQTIGWTLLHFIWQGALFAVLLSVALGLLRTAKARYAAALCALVLMGISPAVTFLVLFRAPAPEFPVPIIHGALQTIHDVALAPVLSKPETPSLEASQVDWLSLAVLLWFAGILVLSLRALGGWYLTERLRRGNARLTGGLRVLCLQLQERVGIRRTVGYFQSCLVDVPSVIGWFSPVILLPTSALTGLSPSQIEAIIVHELAHIKRLDPFVNLFQIALETILFYHPAVWWVSRRVRAERENCCDDMAVTLCGDPLDYAKALTLMESWRAAPALMVAANGGSLKTRVARLLGLQTFSIGVPRGGLAALTVILSAGALLGGARFTGNLDHARNVTESPGPPDVPAPPPAPQPPATPEPAVPQAPAMPHIAPEAPVAESTLPAPATAPEPPAPPPGNPAPPASPTPPNPPDHSSYIDGMAAAGYSNLSVDDLIAFKVQGITPEYLRDMHATGLTFSRSQLIGMKIQGVTPEYVRHIRDTWKDVTAHDLIAMRIQGVDPNDVNQFRQLGIGDISVHTLIEMKIQGVTPEYARRIRETWKDVTPHDLIEMRIQGVEPGDVGQFRQLGMGEISVHTLIEMKVQGVTPDYVHQMKDAGFNGTTREYVHAKVMGVTPEFVRMVRSHGFTDLTARKLIDLKVAGIF